MDVCSASTALPVRSRNVSLRICTPSARSVRLLGRRRRRTSAFSEALPAIRDGHGKNSASGLWLRRTIHSTSNCSRNNWRNWGRTVYLCQDGREALQAWLSGQFDVLLTDVTMPRDEWLRTGRQVRTLDPLMPIIGVTANAIKEEGGRCVNGQQNTWIVKPLNLRMLYEGLYYPGMFVDLPSRSGGGWLRACRAAWAIGEETRSLMLRVLGEDIDVARACIAREDCIGTLDKLNRIRGSWAIAQGGS
ncbi:response regulator [Pseudomonas aeruginosa]|nr:response regulator [Pseudomonas aeruginosa]